ncbi:putative conidiation-specific expression protein [Tirmania nivea]|nr:putative conidiation-specific expression protein [Tirmania nivea]
MSTYNTNPGNFANRPKKEIREIASKGGHASRKGSSHTGDTQHETLRERRASNTHYNTNPGNFANRPKEEVREVASKGGRASHSGGFASMDPDKQREIASKGGKASSGSFEKGSVRAREAGRKGGSVSSRIKEDE